jgi:hypothetical protein
MITTLYETDFYAWTQRQAELLRSEEFEQVDWDNLIEEIESLGKSQRQEVRNRLTVLIMHLLKLHVQRRAQTRSWRVTVTTQRIDLDLLLADNPSLRANLAAFVVEAYPFAVKKAIAETGLSEDAFPSTCPWRAEQIMDEAFWPVTDTERK